MSSVYGIYGLGIPGEQGENGNNGYSVSVDSNLTKDGSVVSIILDNSIYSTKFSDYNTDERKYYLNNLSFNVYSEVNETTKYYQFNYSINVENTDELKIFAYIFYNDNSTYNILEPSKSEYIQLKDFYEPLTVVKSKILYDDNKKISKIIVFAFEKIKGSIYNKIFLEEKEF